MTNPTMYQPADAEDCLADVANLAAALQVISWQLCQQSIDHGSELAELRDATVGVSRALSALMERGAHSKR